MSVFTQDVYLTYFCFSISAQSSYALGAVLNATCGTVVEMILSVVVLNKGNQSGSACYVELVKSNLAGKIIEIKKFLYLYLKWSKQCSYEEKLWLGGIFFANNWFALCDWKCYLTDGVMAPDADLFFHLLCSVFYQGPSLGASFLFRWVFSYSWSMQCQLARFSILWCKPYFFY